MRHEDEGSAEIRGSRYRVRLGAIDIGRHTCREKVKVKIGWRDETFRWRMYHNLPTLDSGLINV